MKVLHVIPSVSPRDGGPTRMIEQIERALHQRGVAVTTATTIGAGDPEAQTVRCGVPVETPFATRWYFPRTTSFYKTSIPLASWLLHNVGRFDVVHAHALFSFAPAAAAFIARGRGVPFALRPLGVLNRYGMTQHHPLFKRLSLAIIERPLIAAAGAMHFTSGAEKAEAELLHLRCRPVVIPLGLADAATTRCVPREELFDAAEHRLLFLSRLDRKKNLPAVLQAVALLRQRWPGLRLDVAGEGDPRYVAELRLLATSLGLDDRVQWHGYVEGIAKDRLFAEAAAFVLPSFSENFGIAVVEALAAGLPCIISSEVAVHQEVSAAGAGLVVGTDGAAVAAGIEALLSDRERYGRLCAAARRVAADEFSASAMAVRLERLYRSLARASDRSGAPSASVAA